LNRKNFLYLTVTFLVFILFFNTVLAQDTTGSLAFKKNRPIKRSALFYQPDLSYQLWKQLTLTREANGGNPFAEHELGLRYLLGEGTVADTVKGAYWIKRAAEKDLTAACFNYGILLINGWGVEWNPYQAFQFFLQAAKDSMPQAAHVVGLFFTEDLLFERNWDEAYQWIKKSSDANYEPAKKTLKELIEKIPRLKNDSTYADLHANKIDKHNTLDDESAESSIGLVFIDFDLAADSTPRITLKDLLGDLLLIGEEKAKDDLGMTESVIEKEGIDSLNFSNLIKYAENGSPEALSLLGYLYEKGVHFKKDLITAAAYYIRAISLDSPTAKSLLWNLNKDKDLYSDLMISAKQKNPEALFVWYGLNSLEFDNSITKEDAFNLLREAVILKYSPAIVELGLCYYTGKYTVMDKNKAVEIWENAWKIGIKEAKLRLEAAKILEAETSDYNVRINELNSSEQNGSILSQAILGYCYEKGIGVMIDKGKAAKYYRLAAHRGSQYAYKELKRLYAESKLAGK
jgi:TPR repeat protein